LKHILRSKPTVFFLAALLLLAPIAGAWAESITYDGTAAPTQNIPGWAAPMIFNMTAEQFLNAVNGNTTIYPTGSASSNHLTRNSRHFYYHLDSIEHSNCWEETVS
jgi:hypothetical protein